MADYDIFRERLAIKYPSYGHALWEPGPRNPDVHVQVGDVGFVRRGKFYRFFNALLSADDPRQVLGVPEYHEPLVPALANHLDDTLSLGRNHYCSHWVNMKPDPGYHSDPNDFQQVSFQYGRTRGAAVLSLPVAARRCDTLANDDFKEWILKHIDSWFAFARNLRLGIHQMEEIILVTGCDLTRSWTNVAFLGGQADAQATFGVRVDLEGPDTTINFQFSPDKAPGAVLRTGPEGTNLPENQCVFIRGFRAIRSFWRLPRRIEAAAGPSPDPGGYDRDPDVEVISIPANTQYRDPLHLLMDYISEQATDCDMVIVHDDDLGTIRGLGHDSSIETLEPDVMTDLLRRSNLKINQVSCDLSLTGIKVAMLSTTPPNCILYENAVRNTVTEDNRTTGKRKALVIGVNYYQSNFPLRHCTEDARQMASFLYHKLGFKDIRILTDDSLDPCDLPTKRNIIEAMKTLVHGARPDDSFFFYFSGHGMQVNDLDGDELDGLDEYICAMDYRGGDQNPDGDTPGLIVDDTMHDIMVKHLPSQCRLTAVFDCCHPGTILDLPVVYNSKGAAKPFIHPDGPWAWNVKMSSADVVSLSASKNNQEAYENGQGGALRSAFIDSMSSSGFGSTLTYQGLFQNMREYMEQHRLSQKPQLSASHKININLLFEV